MKTKRIEKWSQRILSLVYMLMGAYLCYVLPYQNVGGKIILLTAAGFFVIIADIFKESIEEDIIKQLKR